MRNELVSRILKGENIRKVITESDNNRKYRAAYIVSSERASRRSDEDHVIIRTNRILDVGDSFEMDGLTWYVDEILSDSDRDINESFKGSGNKINFEDDIVAVYDADTGEQLYKGMEDYEDLKDEPWKWDASIGAYRLEQTIDGKTYKYIKNCL